MPITREELARRLRRAREACHLKQEDLARHLGVSRSTIAQMEAGNRSVSSLELDKLAYLFGRDIREFLAEEYQQDDVFAVLFRLQPEVAEKQAVQAALREAAALGRELTNLERLLGIERDLTALPAYSFARPRSKWRAIQQGEHTAEEERRRLGLGTAPLPNLAELLESQGLRTAQLELPEDVSGLTLLHEAFGVFIAVNNLEPGHSRLRRRFSYAHEYCHALLDRGQKGIVSRAEGRENLSEVRANVFAAAFLMPTAAVRDFVERLGKGRRSRFQADVFDEDQAHRVSGRSEPGSQAIQMHDVVLLAHHFGVSRLSALYRLKNLGLLTQPELEGLLEQEEAGAGRALQELLDLPEPDAEDARNEFRHRFLALGLEAFRRGEITGAKLRELAELVQVAETDLEQTLQRVGFGEADEDVDGARGN